MTGNSEVMLLVLRCGPQSFCDRGPLFLAHLRTSPLSDARLLLRHAMQRAEAEDEVAASDADDFAIGK